MRLQNTVGARCVRGKLRSLPHKPLGNTVFHVDQICSNPAKIALLRNGRSR